VKFKKSEIQKFRNSEIRELYVWQSWMGRSLRTVQSIVLIFELSMIEIAMIRMPSSDWEIDKYES
jgi:hypothetical protein